MPLADIEHKIDKGELAWGSAKDVGDRLIEGAQRVFGEGSYLRPNFIGIRTAVGTIVVDQ